MQPTHLSDPNWRVGHQRSDLPMVEVRVVVLPFLFGLGLRHTVVPFHYVGESLIWQLLLLVSHLYTHPALFRFSCHARQGTLAECKPPQTGAQLTTTTSQHTKIAKEMLQKSPLR